MYHLLLWTLDNKRLIQQLKTCFSLFIKKNKCISEKRAQAKNNVNYLYDPTFQKVKKNVKKSIKFLKLCSTQIVASILSQALIPSSAYITFIFNCFYAFYFIVLYISRAHIYSSF